jgi:hypothetical protein
LDRLEGTAALRRAEFCIRGAAACGRERVWHEGGLAANKKFGGKRLVLIRADTEQEGAVTCEPV